MNNKELMDQLAKNGKRKVEQEYNLELEITIDY